MTLRNWRIVRVFWAKGLIASVGTWVLLHCSPSTAPKTDLAPVLVSGIQLTLIDPESGLRGVKISFAPQEPEDITSFQLYRSLRADSLGAPFQSEIAAGEREVLIPLPDSSPPMTVYFGLRAIQKLETGETWSSEEMPIDSVVVLPPVQIYAPGKGDTLAASVLPLEVRANSDQGILLRQLWWEKDSDQWTLRLDTCLPRHDCITPRFGAVSQTDTVTLNFVSTIPKPALLCVQGSEVFDGRQTAQRQSLACTRFYRKNR
jgi:hypothetical protein